MRGTPRRTDRHRRYGLPLPRRRESPDELWRLLCEQRDTVSAFPTDRGWDSTCCAGLIPTHRGHIYVRAGSFVPDVGDFDASFFGIGPREAQRWSLSSDFSSRCRGRRWSGRPFTRRLFSAVTPAFSSGCAPRSTDLASATNQRDSADIWQRDHGLCRVRPAVLHAWAPRPGDLGRHRLLVISGGRASCRPIVALG